MPPKKKPAYLFKIHAFNTRKKCTNTCTMQAHTRTRFVSDVLCTLHIYTQTHPHTHRVASDCRLLFALESMLLVLCCMSILPLLPYESSSKPRDERMDMLRRDRIGKKTSLRNTHQKTGGEEGVRKGKFTVEIESHKLFVRLILAFDIMLFFPFLCLVFFVFGKLFGLTFGESNRN